MEKKYKTIPFDVNRINEEGVKVVTRNGKNVRILCTDANNMRNIFGLINSELDYSAWWYSNGRVYSDYEVGTDLFLQVPIKTRRMTNQELSWWLRECPEEHREYKFKTNPLIYHEYIYKDDDVNKVIDDRILIRSNGGEWKEPLIEIE